VDNADKELSTHHSNSGALEMDWLNLLSGILSHSATVTFLGVFAAFALDRFIDHAKNTINKKTLLQDLHEESMHG